MIIRNTLFYGMVLATMPVAGCRTTSHEDSDDMMRVPTKVRVLQAKLLADREANPGSLFFVSIEPTGIDRMIGAESSEATGGWRPYDILFSDTTIARAKLAVVVRVVLDQSDTLVMSLIEPWFWQDGRWLSPRDYVGPIKAWCPPEAIPMTE